MLGTVRHVAIRGLVYIGLALGFLALCGLIVWVAIREHISNSGPWIFLAGYTGVLVYASIAPLRQSWHRPAFWAAVGGLVAVHLLGFAFILRHYPMWRPLWYIPVVTVEAALFALILTVMFKDRP
jgi:hypothetical protein